MISLYNIFILFHSLTLFTLFERAMLCKQRMDEGGWGILVRFQQFPAKKHIFSATFFLSLSLPCFMFYEYRIICYCCFKTRTFQPHKNCERPHSHLIRGGLVHDPRRLQLPRKGGWSSDPHKKSGSLTCKSALNLCASFPLSSRTIICASFSNDILYPYFKRENESV